MESVLKVKGVVIFASLGRLETTLGIVKANSPLIAVTKRTECE